MFEFENLVVAPNVYVCAKNKNLKYTYCNENFAQLIGLDSPNQIVDKSDDDFFDEHFIKLYHSGDYHVLDGGVYLNMLEINPKVSSAMSVLVSKCLTQNTSGIINGLIISFMRWELAAIGLNVNKLKYEATHKRYEFHIGQHLEYFTEREYQVFKRILMGSTAKQIAQSLNLSFRTVEEYIVKIKNKLQCHSKHHIVEAAMRLELIHQNIF